MASFPDLRPYARLAKAESKAAPSFGSLVVLLTAFTAVPSIAFVAVSELATLRGQKALTTSARLTRTRMLAFLVRSSTSNGSAA